jgi:protease-4
VVISVTWATVAVCLVVTLFLVLSIFLPSPTSDRQLSYVYGDGSNELLSIKISGMITGEDGPGLGSFLGDQDQTAGYYVKEQLYAAADDDLINGVILEISSPGGTIYGSRAIADGVVYYKKKTGNPVYAYVQGEAASGAYWAASSTDKILADYGSDIGSIGVVMGPFQYYDGVLAEDGGLLEGGVVTQRGIQNTFVTAGKSKDVGNPYRKLTGDELASFQTAVNNEYDAFVRYVSIHRKMTEDKLRNTIGAMAYDNKTAIDFGLIDGTASRDDAYTQLAKAAGIEDDFTIIREDHAPGLVESLLAARTNKPGPKAARNLCTLTQSILVYHGDVSALCAAR